MKKIILSLFLIINISSFKSVSQDLKIGYTNVEYLLTFLPETKQVQSEVSAYGTDGAGTKSIRRYSVNII